MKKALNLLVLFALACVMIFTSERVLTEYPENISRLEAWSLVGLTTLTAFVTMCWTNIAFPRGDGKWI